MMQMGRNKKEDGRMSSHEVFINWGERKKKKTLDFELRTSDFKFNKHNYGFPC